MNNSGLYIHIPFCKSKCLYCDFNSFADKDGCIETYFSALEQELLKWSVKLQGKTFDTIYFGGGTPSFAGAKRLAGIIAAAKQSFCFATDTEITVECNPKTIDFEGFLTLKNAGVSRLSIGLQSTDNSVLKKLGRIHSVQDFESCFADARRSGFDNISIDLMYGLPDMSLKGWSDTIDKAINYDAEHISAYALKIEDGTPFSKMALNLPDEDMCADMYEMLVQKLRAAGYERYEISNFSKENHPSRHNQKYWELTDYLGIGAGAYSCIDSVRFSNEEDIDTYISLVKDTGFAIADKTAISRSEQMSEFVFLGLRCERGISLAEFEARFDAPLESVFGDAVAKYVKLGFLEISDGRMKFTDKGFFVSNIILADFI